MKSKKNAGIAKTQTGIHGLDEITGGGLPQGRPTLVCGSAGCGKTLFATQFLVRGITEFKEPGVFMSFEETAVDLTENVSSLGFDLKHLVDNKQLRIDHIRVNKSEIQETGEYDLEGLFIRLNYAIESIGARRVVLDTIESLFGGMENSAVLRSEIRRLFQWLKEKGITAIITGERGESSLTRQGLEEYVSDCVILLDFRVIDQIATRRLRIVKYRGSMHGTNEYPFLIDETGVSVLPITSVKLEHDVSGEILSYGVPSLDKLFTRKGYYRGSSVLISGTAGTSKTTLSSHIALSSCARGEKTLYFSFEESPDQLVRNLLSVGIDLRPHLQSKLLEIHSSRPSIQGLEMHLLVIHRLITQCNPKTVILDPISSLMTIGSNSELRALLIRLLDILSSGINAVFTALTHDDQTDFSDLTVDAVSSLTDTWIRVMNEELNGRRSRRLVIVKSRGMGHSNDMLHLDIGARGITLQAPGPERTAGKKRKQKTS